MATELSEKTNHLYATNIGIMKKAGLDPLNVEATMHWIRESTYGPKGKKRATTTQKNMVCAATHWIKNVPGSESIRDQYRKILVDYTKIITETYKDQKLTETEKGKFLAWPEILKAAEIIRKDVRLLDSDKLLVDFYTGMPPVRLDYCNLALLTAPPADPKKGNYAVIRKRGRCYIHLNEHKTMKKYGAIENEIPTELARRIRLFMKSNPDQKILFKMDDKQMNRLLTRLFFNACEKKISVNVLRHSYISNFLEGAPSLRECEALAQAMGHSVMLQQYYRRMKDRKDDAKSESSSSDSESDDEEVKVKMEKGLVLVL